MYWESSYITKAKLIKQITWLTDEFFVGIELVNRNFRVEIRPPGRYYSMVIHMFEQFGCCGYSNIQKPITSHVFTNLVPGKTQGELYLDVVEAMSDLVCSSGIQFVGTRIEWLFSAMRKRHWKLVHKMPNRKYTQRGRMLYVWCKNMNAFRNGRPVRPRIRNGIYG